MFNLFSTTLEKYKTISPAAAKERLQSGDKMVLLDVRSLEEHYTTRIKNSICLPVDVIAQNIERVIPDKNTEIIVYCRSGMRATTACKQLSKMGYTNVSNLGGIMSWSYETVSGR